MATAKNFQFKTENYKEQVRVQWPPMGRHILGQYDEECIIVYQAFCPEIADYAVKNGKFGGARYSFTRMTWIKTNFLWMMYRSNWAQKKNQERILAIYLTREGFDQILKFSKGSGIRVEGRTPGNVRIQWDPDHDPKGQNQRRRAVQLGIKGIPQQRFHEQYIQHIDDITDFVKQQRQHVLKNELYKLLTPTERVYRPSEEGICRHILLDDFRSGKKDTETVNTITGKLAPLECNSPNNTDDDGEDAESDSSGDHEDVRPEKSPRVAKTNKVCKKNKRDLIVCLGGSFNPIHRGHIHLLETAITWLEKNTHFNVVAARLAVMPDTSVEKRFKRRGEKVIKAEHRINLCNLVCKGHKLIKTNYTTIVSAYNCGENVKKWENLQNAEVAVVIGADKVVSSDGHWVWKQKSKYLTVCVGRIGITEVMRKAYHEETNEDLGPKPDFYVIEDELVDVYSADIRRQLREIEPDNKSETTQTKSIYFSHSDIKTRRKETDPEDGMNSKMTKAKERTVPITWDEMSDEELDNHCDDFNKDGILEHDGVGINENHLPILDMHDVGDTVSPIINDLNLEQNVAKNIPPDNDNVRASDVKYNTKQKEGGLPKARNCKNVAPQNNETSSMTMSKTVDDLVSKAWLMEAAGEYIVNNFDDLYL